MIDQARQTLFSSTDRSLGSDGKFNYALADPPPDNLMLERDVLDGESSQEIVNNHSLNDSHIDQMQIGTKVLFPMHCGTEAESAIENQLKDTNCNRECMTSPITISNDEKSMNISSPIAIFGNKFCHQTENDTVNQATDSMNPSILSINREIHERRGHLNAVSFDMSTNDDINSNDLPDTINIQPDNSNIQFSEDVMESQSQQDHFDEYDTIYGIALSNNIKLPNDTHIPTSISLNASHVPLNRWTTLGTFGNETNKNCSPYRFPLQVNENDNVCQPDMMNLKTADNDSIDRYQDSSTLESLNVESEVGILPNMIGVWNNDIMNKAEEDQKVTMLNEKNNLECRNRTFIPIALDDSLSAYHEIKKSELPIVQTKQSIVNLCYDQIKGQKLCSEYPDDKHKINPNNSMKSEYVLAVSCGKSDIEATNVVEFECCQAICGEGHRCTKSGSIGSVLINENAADSIIKDGVTNEFGHSDECSLADDNKKDGSFSSFGLNGNDGKKDDMTIGRNSQCNVDMDINTRNATDNIDINATIQNQLKNNSCKGKQIKKSVSFAKSISELIPPFDRISLKSWISDTCNDRRGLKAIYLNMIERGNQNEGAAMQYFLAYIDHEYESAKLLWSRRCKRGFGEISEIFVMSRARGCKEMLSFLKDAETKGVEKDLISIYKSFMPSIESVPGLISIWYLVTSFGFDTTMTLKLIIVMELKYLLDGSFGIETEKTSLSSVSLGTPQLDESLVSRSALTFNKLFDAIIWHIDLELGMHLKPGCWNWYNMYGHVLSTGFSFSRHIDAILIRAWWIRILLAQEPILFVAGLAAHLFRFRDQLMTVETVAEIEQILISIKSETEIKRLLASWADTLNLAGNLPESFSGTFRKACLRFGILSTHQDSVSDGHDMLDSGSYGNLVSNNRMKIQTTPSNSNKVSVNQVTITISEAGDSSLEGNEKDGETSERIDLHHRSILELPFVLISASEVVKIVYRRAYIELIMSSIKRKMHGIGLCQGACELEVGNFIFKIDKEFTRPESIVDAMHLNWKHCRIGCISAFPFNSYFSKEPAGLFDITGYANPIDALIFLEKTWKNWSCVLLDCRSMQQVECDGDCRIRNAINFDGFEIRQGNPIFRQAALMKCEMIRKNLICIIGTSERDPGALAVASLLLENQFPRICLVIGGFDAIRSAIIANDMSSQLLLEPAPWCVGARQNNQGTNPILIAPRKLDIAANHVRHWFSIIPKLPKKAVVSTWKRIELAVNAKNHARTSGKSMPRTSRTDHKNTRLCEQPGFAPPNSMRELSRDTGANSEKRWDSAFTRNIPDNRVYGHVNGTDDPTAGWWESRDAISMSDETSLESRQSVTAVEGGQYVDSKIEGNETEMIGTTNIIRLGCTTFSSVCNANTKVYIIGGDTDIEGNNKDVNTARIRT